MTLAEAEVVFGKKARSWNTREKVEFARAFTMQDLVDSDSVRVIREGYVGGFGPGSSLASFCQHDVFMALEGWKYA